MIQPHGGKRIDRVVKNQRERVLDKAKRLFQLVLEEDKVKEVQNIAHGIFALLMVSSIRVIACQNTGHVRWV